MMMITFTVPEEKERTVTAMAEYIACRSCDSPDCKGCNLKRLETMLENGEFDCLMNENRAINTSADFEPVRHGQWIYNIESGEYVCSACGENALSFRKDTFYGVDLYETCLTDYCPKCGARMDEEAHQ